MLDFMVRPRPLPHPTQDAREAATYSDTVTIHTETATTGFQPLTRHENLRGLRYPVSGTGNTPRDYETARNYTDLIRLNGYYPRLHSGQYANVVDRTGEAVFYMIVDVDQAGDGTSTTLLCRRHGVDLT